jgi:predicted phosphodiesterase
LNVFLASAQGASVRDCDDCSVVTAIISDLHLGLGSGADLLRREDMRARLVAALDGTDRLVLLGDLLELRDRPLTEALAAAEPVFAALGEAMADGEIVMVAGNHDHHLIEPWLERRALEGAPPLGLEQRGEPEGLAMTALCEHAAPARVTFAYPGLWLRDDVYAIHGQYLDRHLTVPTIERLGVAAVEKTLGIVTPTEDPLEPPGDRHPASIDEYERVQTPVYALLFGLAQGTVGERRGGADPSARLWKMLSGGDTRTARMRNWLLGSVAVPGAVGIANRLGLGPVRSELSTNAIGRAGFEAMAEAARVLQIEADHLIFGHTHWRGSPKHQGKPQLLNTGNWVHSPGLLGSRASQSPYWPGTICFVDDEGPPRLEGLLDDLSRDELAGKDG